jgi:hypothetical protein
MFDYIFFLPRETPDVNTWPLPDTTSFALHMRNQRICIAFNIIIWIMILSEFWKFYKSNKSTYIQRFLTWFNIIKTFDFSTLAQLFLT